MGKGNLKAIIAGVACGILGIVFAINQATSLNEPVAVYSPPPEHHRPTPGHSPSRTPTPFETFSAPQGSYRPPSISMPAGGSHRPAGNSSEPVTHRPIRPIHHPVPHPSPKPTPTPIQVPVLPGLVCKTLGGVQIGEGGHLLVCTKDDLGQAIWSIL